MRYSITIVCLVSFMLAPTSRKMLNEPYFKASYLNHFIIKLIAKMPLFSKFPNQT